MRRRRPVEEAVSHDRWLVSYADFVTLLFAFFVVLFASAYHDRRSVTRVSNSVREGFEVLGSKQMLRSSASTAASPSAGIASDKPEEGPSPSSSQHNNLSPADLLELKRQLQAAMGLELRNREIELRSTPEGFVISLKELGFFNSARADLLPGAADKITRIARILARHQLELRIEGHSDNQPIANSGYRSNWELSTARALAVLQLVLDSADYDPKQVSVAGYGEYRPLASDATPEGRRMNRRVDLVVLGSTPPTAAHSIARPGE